MPVWFSFYSVHVPTVSSVSVTSDCCLKLELTTRTICRQVTILVARRSGCDDDDGPLHSEV